ncbi:hypothetical protein P5V15_006371 [Pogonomyrmex californicus]
MANVRDSDTSLWLHNKLGTSNDSWTGSSICSQLNAEVLRNIKDCFPDLQTQVKLKLLLSFFHIPRRNVEEWRVELEEIIEVASLDSELWVSMLSEAMKTFPSTGSLNTDITDLDEHRPIFGDLVNDLRKLLKKQNDPAMLPLECHYLNKTALTSVVGQQPTPVKHFTLKRKPKSAALRAELLQKSTDAANNLKKSTAPTVPREQMLEAQEMFRTANKVTRPEKALILGFMAGSRDNPCPKLGNIVTVMLSENIEEVTQSDGTTVPMLVETHFQMNYTNGEWKRIKKNRRIVTEESTSATAPAPNATATASN